MYLFLHHFKWVMLISGILICTMFIGFVSPQSSLNSNFGESLEGPLANIIYTNKIQYR